MKKLKHSGPFKALPKAPTPAVASSDLRAMSVLELKGLAFDKLQEIERVMALVVKPAQAVTQAVANELNRRTAEAEQAADRPSIPDTHLVPPPQRAGPDSQPPPDPPMPVTRRARAGKAASHP